MGNQRIQSRLRPGFGKAEREIKARLAAGEPLTAALVAQVRAKHEPTPSLAVVVVQTRQQRRYAARQARKGGGAAS